MDLTHVEIIGGGPAGLYIAILLRQSFPEARVVVREQNACDATFGFGVVFSDQALNFLRADDPVTYDLITPEMVRWQNMTLAHSGESVVLDGIGFAAVGRLRLLNLLQNRAAKTGVELRYNERVDQHDESSADLVIGADGFNSRVRQATPEQFKVSQSEFSNHFVWFGTSQPFDTLTQTFVKTNQGAFNAHHYRYEESMSTFIVECDHSTFIESGLDKLDERKTLELCEKIFEKPLQGKSLIANKSIWRQFPKLWCDSWFSGNKVLLGDAAHTAHFSIGSGTRLAMEDAIALNNALVQHDEIGKALQSYEDNRKPIAKKIVNAANTSATWYENFADKLELNALDFAFDYITRSGRIDLERLRKMSPEFMQSYEKYREKLT